MCINVDLYIHECEAARTMKWYIHIIFAYKEDEKYAIRDKIDKQSV